MISVVCIYNNEKIFNDYLLKSLKAQTAKYEIIKLDNTNGRFDSAAEALNYGGRKAKGKYLMFVHQDVNLFSDTWLEEAEKILDKLPKLGVAGIAGRSDNEELIITKMKHGYPPGNAGKMKFEKPIKVQTLDECLVIIPNIIFTSLKFDESVCDTSISEFSTIIFFVIFLVFMFGFLLLAMLILSLIMFFIFGQKVIVKIITFFKKYT